jgi:DNA/RNA endonuclease YhcR with UshA esterase domain
MTALLCGSTGQLRIFCINACCVAIVSILLSCLTARAAVVTVTNTNDSGTGSLRSAITYANAHSGTTIAFNLSGSPAGGYFSIQPTSSLPWITADGTVIDGTTQTAVSNSNPSGPEVQIDFSQLVNHESTLEVHASNCVVRGLILNGYTFYTAAAAGVVFTGRSDGSATSGNRLEGCYLGTDATGTMPGLPTSNETMGVLIDSTSQNNIIGGTAAAARNVISGSVGSTYSGLSIGIFIRGNDNTVQGNFIGTTASGSAPLSNGWGVSIAGARNIIGGTSAGAGNVISCNVVAGVELAGPATDNKVQGNFIGTNAGGTAALGTSTAGIQNFGIVIRDGAQNNLVGGTQSGARNVVSGHRFYGIRLTASADPPASGNLVQGNFIGTDVSGTIAIPNYIGVTIDGRARNNAIGGTASGAANLIAFNATGVLVANLTVTDSTSTRIETPSGTTIRGNVIRNHTSLGINLGGNDNSDGVTPNDIGDADTGPNDLQNFPVLTSAQVSGNITTITGSLRSKANATYTIDFYANRQANPTGYGEGETYLGSITAMTDAQGQATLNFSAPANLDGQQISATATSDGGDTSEFAQAIAATSVPLPPNQPPTISNIDDQTGDEDTSKQVPFTVQDAETSALNLTLTGTSSNPALMPDSNIVFGGSGINRTVTLTPVANQAGTATITITVNDGSGTATATASRSFLLTVSPVNDAPRISAIPNATIKQGTSTGSIAFTIDDVDTPLSALTLSGDSSNPTLVPISGINFGGADGNRSVTVTPLSDQAGTTTITITVSDGNSTAQAAFLVTVLPPPAITSFTPASGTAGTSVTITGVSLSGTTEVRFNGTPALFTPIADTTVRATVPAGATSGKITLTATIAAIPTSATSSSDFIVIPTYNISGRIATGANAGIPNVSVTRSGATTPAGANTAVTDSNGNYTILGVPAGSYTFTPTLAQYSFSPLTRSVVVNAAAVSGINFTGTQATYTIRGHIANNSGTGMAGIIVTRSGGPNVTTDANGDYIFTNVVAGSYTIAPLTTAALSGVTFTPASLAVTLNTSSLTNVNFTASFTISGRVANHSGAGIANVQVQRIAGASVVSVFTDSNGDYRFSSVRSGAYTIMPVLTPAMAGMSFTPTSRAVTVDRGNLTNVNFIGMFSISGRLANHNGTGIPNVQVQSIAGSVIVSVFTDSNGNYRLSGMRSGTYTIAPVLTPAMSGMSFTPTATSVTIGTASLTNINFIGMFSISGRIATSAGVARANVLVHLSAGSTSTSVLTDSNGNYRFSNVHSGSYTITPAATGLTPASRNVTVGTLSLTNQNFIG